MSTEQRSLPASALISFIDDEVSSGDEPVRADTDLVLSGLVDSLGVVRIVEWLERHLDIEIDPADVVIEHFGTVTAIGTYLKARHARVLD